MKQSLIDHFDIISTRISPTLLGPGAVRSVKKLCSLFPYDITGDFGFESRLGDPLPACDLSMQIRNGSEGGNILAGKSHVSSLSPTLLREPLWQKMGALFTAWSVPGGILAEKVDSFWLEFDHTDNSFN
ncbi:MAG: hypothetical protein WCO93_12995, partial [bacterium]